MEIRTYQGTTFSVVPIDDSIEDYELYSSLHVFGELTNPEDLVYLAEAIRKATDLGIDLDFSID